MISNRVNCSKTTSQWSTAESCKAGKKVKGQVQSISRLRQPNISFFRNGEQTIVSPMKKISAQEFIEKTTFLVNYYHKSGKIGFYVAAIKFLNKDWVEYRAKLNERLNKIIYLEPTLKYKTYSEIELQIMKEWKKNHILYALQTIWFNSLIKYDFQSAQEFQLEYQTQKNFIAQLAYLMSKPFFQILQQKGLRALDRLTEETASFIITSYDDWKKVYDMITKLYDKGNAPSDVNFDFDLVSLQVQDHIFDLREEESLKKTIQQMRKFSSQFKVMDKIKTLKSIRASLEEEIKTNQYQLIQRGRLQKLKTIEKDDFISCYIYCIVKGEIRDFGLSLNMLKFTLGSQMSMVLSRWGVDSYRADLQSAHQYLMDNSLTTSLVRNPMNVQRSHVVTICIATDQIVDYPLLCRKLKKQ